MNKPKALFTVETEYHFNRVYGPEVRKAIGMVFDIPDKVYTKAELLADKTISADVEYIFSTWSISIFTHEEVKELFPKVKCLYYAAGTVQAFARPFLDNGIRVFSAWGANAIPVAETTLAQILLANKGFFNNLIKNKQEGFNTAAKYFNETYPGNFNVEVGIIGAGMIGKLVIQLLKPFRIKVKVFDPFLPDEKAEELGVTKTSLEDIFTNCQTISNHLANNSQTQGMLNYNLFKLMKPGATFINTGRGAQVVEADLVRALKEEPNRTAVLDVTWPEPPVDGSEITQLPNIYLTTHIAGSSGYETWRMAEYMLEESMKVLEGKQPLYEVTYKMLETMA